MGGGVAIIIAIWVRLASSGDRYAIEHEVLAGNRWREAGADLPVGVDIVEPGEGGGASCNKKRIVGAAEERTRQALVVKRDSIGPSSGHDQGCAFIRRENNWRIPWISARRGPRSRGHRNHRVVSGGGRTKAAQRHGPLVDRLAARSPAGIGCGRDEDSGDDADLRRGYRDKYREAVRRRRAAGRNED
jgi:hypothetical protein